MTDDQLADIVIEGVKKIRYYLPLIIAFKGRFDCGDRDRANRLKTPIKGCVSWKEFCVTYLDTTPDGIQKAIRKALAPKHDGSAHRKPTPLDKESWIDYQPNFLSADEAQKRFAWANDLNLWQQETGQCDAAPTHDTIQWGPRQAYLACVPGEFRVKSSGEIPSELLPLHGTVERRYKAAFNTIQLNRHWNENSVVQPHSDNMHGDIVMLTLIDPSFNKPRRFILRYKHDDTSQQQRWKAGDIFFDEVLPSGSLLTIYKAHQFDLTHEMPRADKPCGGQSRSYGDISPSQLSQVHSGDNRSSMELKNTSEPKNNGEKRRCRSPSRRNRSNPSSSRGPSRLHPSPLPSSSQDLQKLQRRFNSAPNKKDCPAASGGMSRSRSAR